MNSLSEVVNQFSLFSNVQNITKGLDFFNHQGP